MSSSKALMGERRQVPLTCADLIFRLERTFEGPVIIERIEIRAGTLYVQFRQSPGGPIKSTTIERS